MYGDATSKEVINFLSLNQTLPAADKVRARRAGAQRGQGGRRGGAGGRTQGQTLPASAASGQGTEG